MNAGCLLQGPRKIDYQNISIIRGVIVGEVPQEALVEPGDASLVVNGEEFAGAVLEINGRQIVFSSPKQPEISRLIVDADPDEELRADDDEPVAQIVNRGREMGF